MAMEEALVERIAADATLAPLVGEAVSWFDRQRGDPTTAISLSKVSPGREWTHSGPDGLDRPRVRFDMWSEDADRAAAMGRAVLAMMEAPATVDGVRFHVAEIAAERWFAEGEQEGGEPLYRVQQEYLFFHEEV